MQMKWMINHDPPRAPRRNMEPDLGNPDAAHRNRTFLNDLDGNCTRELHRFEIGGGEMNQLDEIREKLKLHDAWKRIDDDDYLDHADDLEYLLSRIDIALGALRSIQTARHTYVIRDPGPFKDSYEAYSKGTAFAFDRCNTFATEALAKITGQESGK
jgi:hypothetical protein